MKHPKIIVTVLRCCLVMAILLNLFLIFGLSAESGEQSAGTSRTVTEIIAEIFVPHYRELSPQEQREAVQGMEHFIRKLAHMTEFGMLGSLVLFLQFTFRFQPKKQYFVSLGATYFVACADEVEQNFSDSRGPQFTDTLIDLSGAVLACGLILLILALSSFFRKQRRLTVTHYEIQTSLPKEIKIAIAADLHGNDPTAALCAIGKESPDYILIPGDLTGYKALKNGTDASYAFLEACSEMATTVYSLGNHETGCHHKGNPWKYIVPKKITPEVRNKILSTGVTYLDDEIIDLDGISFCGLSSGLCGRENIPNQAVIQEFAKQKGYRILLCHHPEYYEKYIRATDIDLIVSGHAHGGHWRLFGHAIYSPGQGLFPKYTSGIIESRLVISRGLGNHTWIPRLWNQPELVILTLKTK